MSWCTVEQVTQLISSARLRSDVDQVTRKSADLHFIELCASAVNAGDVLIQLGAESSASSGLRLNALLAAETLLNKSGWCEGTQFSDRSEVRQRLLHYVAVASTPSLDGKVDTEILRCLAMIVALEFPTTEWQEWMYGCAVRFTAGDVRSGAALCAVAAESYKNSCLWSYFGNDVTGFLLDAQTTTLPLKTAVMQLFLDLMRKRPRPSVEHEVASAANCLLLSAPFRQRMLEALLKRVEEWELLTESTCNVFFSECAVSFALASRLVTDAESAAIVFRASFFFLVGLQSMAVGGGNVVGSELHNFTEQLLECLISTLQLHPDVAGTNASAETFLSCLIHFMVRPDSLEWGDAEQFSAELLEYFVDDEAVPLGCGSGDVPSLAGAALELYLEHHLAQRPLAIVVIDRFISGTPEMSGSLIEAVALALRSISRVYEASDDAAIDALEGAHLQVELLTHVSQLLFRTSHLHAHIMLIDALVHCFYGSQNHTLCRQMVELLQRLYMNTTESADEHGVYVRCACVYLAGRLVDELRSQEWCEHLLSPEWLHLSLVQLCDGDAFGIFSGASTLCTFLSIRPANVHQLNSCLTMWDQGLTRLCRHATNRGVAGLLTLILKHLSGLSFAPSAFASSPDGLQLVSRSCNTVLDLCRYPFHSRHLVVRSLVDFFIAFTRTLLCADPPILGKSRGVDQLCSVAAILISKDYTLELAQDESSCRGLATFAALYSIASSHMSSLPQTLTSTVLVGALQYAVQQCYASQTVSCVCSRLAIVLISQPSRLGEAMAHVLHTLFRDNFDISLGCKGINYGGVAFLVSMLLLRSPHTLVQSAISGGGTVVANTGEHLRATQRAFGWWLSFAPFMDAIQFLYFTAATCRLVDAVGELPQEERVNIGGLVACRQYILPSPYVKKIPSRPLTGGHLLQHLAVAWVDLDKRHSRTSKPQLFEKELRPFLLSLDTSYEILSGQSFSSSTARDLIKASTSETIAAVLEHMRRLGWSDMLVEGQHQVQSAQT